MIINIFIVYLETIDTNGSYGNYFVPLRDLFKITGRSIKIPTLEQSFAHSIVMSNLVKREKSRSSFCAKLKVIMMPLNANVTI